MHNLLDTILFGFHTAQLLGQQLGARSGAWLTTGDDWKDTSANSSSFRLMKRGGGFMCQLVAVPITLIMFPTFSNQLITDTPAIPTAFLQQDLLGVVASPYPAFEAPYLL